MELFEICGAGHLAQRPITPDHFLSLLILHPLARSRSRSIITLFVVLQNVITPFLSGRLSQSELLGRQIVVKSFY